MGNGQPACWDVKRTDATAWHGADAFFNEAESGMHCGDNWYEGNAGLLGLQGRPPGFSAAAPALLGFDENLDSFCGNKMRAVGLTPSSEFGHAGNCVAVNLNILSLYGDRLPYNICRNLEWQICAAKGLLPGQGGSTILFGRAPSTLDPAGRSGKPLGKCKGWVPDKKPKGGIYGYATDDIFYLELCLFNQICENGAELWDLEVGDPWQCRPSRERIMELKAILLEPRTPQPPDARKCTGATPG